MPIEKQLTNEQRVLVTIDPKTNKGKPAPIDGDPVVTVVSGEGTVTPHESGDTKKFWLNSGESPGDTAFLIEADADIGEGKETISDIVTLRVKSANAANLGVAVGEPENKPD